MNLTWLKFKRNLNIPKYWKFIIFVNIAYFRLPLSSYLEFTIRSCTNFSTGLNRWKKYENIPIGRKVKFLTKLSLINSGINFRHILIRVKVDPLFIFLANNCYTLVKIITFHLGNDVTCFSVVLLFKFDLSSLIYHYSIFASPSVKIGWHRNVPYKFWRLKNCGTVNNY